MKKTLALKYRPKKLDDLVGHEQVKNHLTGMLKNNRIPNAILIVGPSGVGKTTISRLLVRYINCESNNACGKCSVCLSIDNNNHEDYEEVNGSESGNIEKIRQLIEMSNYAPRNSMRIIHIDECHRMSNAASNALLVPIEEPPENTLWILSTTDPEKIPNTKAITGRCAHLILSLPNKDEIADKLKFIGSKEKFKWLTDKMCSRIAEASGGHVRDAIQILEAIFYRIKGSDKKLNRKDIYRLVDDIPTKAIDINVDKIALSILVGIYEKNPVRVQKGIFSCDDHFMLVNKMMQINMYFIGHLSIKKHEKLWRTKVNLALIRALKDKDIHVKLSEAVKTHSALLEIKSTILDFVISSDNILTSKLTILACKK